MGVGGSRWGWGRENDQARVLMSSFFTSLFYVRLIGENLVVGWW